MGENLNYGMIMIRRIIRHKIKLNKSLKIIGGVAGAIALTIIVTCCI